MSYLFISVMKGVAPDGKDVFTGQHGALHGCPVHDSESIVVLEIGHV